MAHEVFERLSTTFAPTALEVLDESAAHHGHAAVRAGAGGHLRVTIAARAFVGLTSLNRQRLVHECLTSFFTSGRLHALALSIHTPEEWDAA